MAKAAGFSTEAEINASLTCDNEGRDVGRISCHDSSAGMRVSPHTVIQFSLYEPRPHRGRIGRIIKVEMESLVGLTVEQAKQRLKELGHVGQVIVEVNVHFDPACRQGAVCGTNHPGGALTESEIRLRINKAKLEIAPPP